MHGADYDSCNACPSRLLLQFNRGTFLQKALMFFAVAACETSYNQGLNQVHLATDYSLHKPSASLASFLI